MKPLRRSLWSVTIAAVSVAAWCDRSAVASYIVAWGRNDTNQCSVPAGGDFVDVAGPWDRGMALKSDGTLVNWGRQLVSPSHVPQPSGTFSDIDALNDHIVAIKPDGSLVDWGYNYFGTCNNTPPGTNYASISAGGWHSLALRSDGSIAAWGRNDAYQCNVPMHLPPNGFAALTATLSHTCRYSRRSTWAVTTGGSCRGRRRQSTRGVRRKVRLSRKYGFTIF